MNKKLLFSAILLIAILGVFAMLITLSGKLADKIIFQPHPDLYTELQDVKTLQLPAGGHIVYRYTPPAPGKLLILHSHGNAENLRTIQWRHQLFADLGYGIITYDYEGYGRSSGKPSEQALERDVMAVYDLITREFRIAPEQIVIHGFSLGTGASSFLASRVRAKALILEAPFTSTYAVAGLQWIPGDRLPSIKRIGKVNYPVLILHGDKDRIIPQRHGREMFKAANEPKRFVDVKGAGHNNIVSVMGDEYKKILNDFLK